MCDASLGRLLDFMDGHDMWADTMLIINTDHGFLLGERGWWAKSVMPWFNELVRLPFFLWDPRTGEQGTRCGALAQTIDIAPTLLRFFGLEPTPDVQGRDLAELIGGDQVPGGQRPPREGGLFGAHGGHVNVTDGRYVYMRAPAEASNAPLDEHTLMPAHMRSRFGAGELADWEAAEPFSFTKGLRTLRIPASGARSNPWLHGTLLFDLATDPGQLRPLQDDDVELHMLRLLARLMHENDAPPGQFQRLGIPFSGEVGPENLLVRAQADRAAATAEPLPPLAELPAADLLLEPLARLLQDPRAHAVVERHVPELTRTELLTLPPTLGV
ncbi:sulfatase/phosphatase domain-containing protein, partial [Klenkia sp. LSe6-5]